MRWAVCIGGYPYGWEPPFLETDNPIVAIMGFAAMEANLVNFGPSMTTVAIFDNDRGEGEPLDPDLVQDRLDMEETA